MAYMFGIPVACMLVRLVYSYIVMIYDQLYKMSTADFIGKPVY